MKRDRIIIVLITIVSYFFFMLFLYVLALNDESASRNSTVHSERQDQSISRFNSNSVVSADLKIKNNFGVDPTPNPPLPPKIQNEIEFMD